MQPQLRKASCRFSVDYERKIIVCMPEEGSNYVVLTTPALYAWHCYNLTTSKGLYHGKLLEVAGFGKDDMVLKMLQGYQIVFASCAEIYVYGFILGEHQGDAVFGFSNDSVREILGSPFLRRKTVFVSHSSADKERVRVLTSKLEKFMNIWIDERSIQAGDSITEQIDSGLASCDAIVLCLSDSSIRSGWVRREYAYGIHQKVKVVPVRMEVCTPPPLMADIKYLDYFKAEDECIKRIFESVEVSVRLDRVST